MLAHVDLLKSWPAIAIWSISSAFLLFQTFSMLLGFAQLMFERNLEQSDFEILLRNLDDAIYIVDKESRLLRFNNAFILLCNRQFNVAPAEGMIFPPADASFPMAIRYRHLLNKAFTGSSFTEELVRANQDTVLYYEYSFYPFLHMNAQVDRVGIICRDITAKKMLDMDMVYARNGMVEMIAHDLKAPLSIIKGVNSDMTDSQHKHFIDKTCSQSIDSIDKLLSFFKYLSVNDRFVYKIEDLAHAVIEKVESMRYAGRLRGQELVIENIDINLYVYVNKAAIARVLDNLIENAIKFSPEPGKILISAQKYNNEGIVKVTDFGLGIPDELQKKIFEKFSLSGKDSAGNASTGLGLFLANSIMKLHGGSITFQSKINEGSTFILKFPLVEVTPN